MYYFFPKVGKSCTELLNLDFLVFQTSKLVTQLAAAATLFVQIFDFHREDGNLGELAYARAECLNKLEWKLINK